MGARKLSQSGQAAARQRASDMARQGNQERASFMQDRASQARNDVARQGAMEREAYDRASQARNDMARR